MESIQPTAITIEQFMQWIEEDPRRHGHGKIKAKSFCPSPVTEFLRDRSDKGHWEIVDTGAPHLPEYTHVRSGTWVNDPDRKGYGDYVFDEPQPLPPWAIELHQQLYQNFGHKTSSKAEWLFSGNDTLALCKSIAEKQK